MKSRVKEIGPIFERIISELPITIVREMQEEFVFGLINKTYLTKADTGILKSFEDRNIGFSENNQDKNMVV